MSLEPRNPESRLQQGESSSVERQGIEKGKQKGGGKYDCLPPLCKPTIKKNHGLEWSHTMLVDSYHPPDIAYGCLMQGGAPSDLSRHPVS